jgi:thiosulfate reductase cytochrome b subunit
VSETKQISKPKGELIYRQNRWTRATHWTWAICLFFLLLSGLTIFNAHPSLYIGQQSGFEFNNAVLEIGAGEENGTVKGSTTILGHQFDTTGYLGYNGDENNPVTTAFPGTVTIPSRQDLATGRVVHFAFAWLLVITLLVWLIASWRTGHIKRDLVITGNDLKDLPTDIKNHARLRFHHSDRYNVLQKLAYAGVLFVLFPLIILTGLAMSPSMDSVIPFLTDILGGRQTARTIHFVTMSLLVLFFIVHMLMIIAAGPINEIRSIITGWYRIDPVKSGEGDK